MRERKTLSISLVFALVGFAGFCSQQSGSEPILLQWKLKQGETLRYRSSVQIQVFPPTPVLPPKPAPKITPDALPPVPEPLPPDPTPITTIQLAPEQEWRIGMTKPTGEVELEVTTLGQTAIQTNQPLYPGVQKPAMVKIDNQGRRLGNPALAPWLSGTIGGGLLGLQGVALPTKPIRIGEQWTTLVPVPDSRSGETVTVKTTLTSIETIGRYRVARLKVTMYRPLRGALDAGLKPVSQPRKETATMVGNSFVTGEAVFAIAEGRTIQSTLNTTTNLRVTHLAPTGKSAPKPTESAPPVMRMEIRSQITTTLNEPTG